MSDVAITVESLGKEYLLNHVKSERYTALRDVIARKVTYPFHQLKNLVFRQEGRGAEQMEQELESFWALKDVSFQIKKGDVVGIIGRNGAGKSTLLKVLSRITEPTKGRVKINGRVSSLLEVGTGFHPELTGRENIFLNGAILGMSQAEIRRKFDEIVAFAEVEKFLDTPVKRYSSGMYVRLAFAVAAHLEPEVLIVDEVLAVGDSQFQKKCLGKMNEVSVKEGRTVLFVSHNMQAISTLTKRGIFLKGGKCVVDGSTREAVAAYLAEGQTTNRVYEAANPSELPYIKRVEVQTSEEANYHVHGKPLALRFEIQNTGNSFGCVFSFQIVDAQMRPVIHLGVFDKSLSRPGSYAVVCHIPYSRLYLGSYTVTVHLAEPQGGKHFQTIEGICPFEVRMFGHSREWEWQPGTCCFVEEASWSVAYLNSNV